MKFLSSKLILTFISFLNFLVLIVLCLFITTKLILGCYLPILNWIKYNSKMILRFRFIDRVNCFNHIQMISTNMNLDIYFQKFSFSIILNSARNFLIQFLYWILNLILIPNLTLKMIIAFLFLWCIFDSAHKKVMK